MHAQAYPPSRRAGTATAVLVLLAASCFAVAGLVGSVPVPLTQLPAALAELAGGAGSSLAATLLDLRLSRAEIGQQLGLTLESVSRAFSRLARERLIQFPERGRREVAIPDLGALAGFVQRSEAGALQ